jgi:hypothetical protein
LRHTYLGWWRDAPIDFATWKDRFPHHIEIAENKASDACRYRDALPLGKIETERTAMTATTIAAMKISVCSTCATLRTPLIAAPSVRLLDHGLEPGEAAASHHTFGFERADVGATAIKVLC